MHASVVHELHMYCYRSFESVITFNTTARVVRCFKRAQQTAKWLPVRYVGVFMSSLSGSCCVGHRLFPQVSQQKT